MKARRLILFLSLCFTLNLRADDPSHNATNPSRPGAKAPTRFEYQALLDNLAESLRKDLLSCQFKTRETTDTSSASEEKRLEENQFSGKANDWIKPLIYSVRTLDAKGDLSRKEVAKALQKYLNEPRARSILLGETLYRSDAPLYEKYKKLERELPSEEWYREGNGEQSRSLIETADRFQASNDTTMLQI